MPMRKNDHKKYKPDLRGGKISILYEDEYLTVIFKPDGMLPFIAVPIRCHKV